MPNPSSSLLFLCYRMARGFGVSVVIENLARGLAARGVAVTIGCIEQDGTIQSLDIRPVKPQPEAIAAVARAVGATTIVAHTSPFFEALPALQGAFSCWAWEHGDPSPAFFDSDRQMREEVVRHKQERVYPALAGVVAISEFIAHDIGWPQAHLIFNGCDHVPDRGSKGLQDFPLGDGAPLRIGTLMRIGRGEARYKGLQAFLDLAAAVQAAGLHGDVHIMGRGTVEDAKPFQAAGIHTHLNATDEERADYLRTLDVFISPSLWEGCNLPLLEAQALGTVGLAYDTGAHPEMTPLLAANARDMLSLVQAYARDRALLRQHSLMCYRFARSTYRWSTAVDDTVRLFGLTAGTASVQLPSLTPPAHRLDWLGIHATKLLWSLRAEGVIGAARRTKAYLSYHLHKDRSG